MGQSQTLFLNSGNSTRNTTDQNILNPAARESVLAITYENIQFPAAAAYRVTGRVRQSSKGGRSVYFEWFKQPCFQVKRVSGKFSRYTLVWIFRLSSFFPIVRIHRVPAPMFYGCGWILFARSEQFFSFPDALTEFHWTFGSNESHAYALRGSLVFVRFARNEMKQVSRDARCPRDSLQDSSLAAKESCAIRIVKLWRKVSRSIARMPSLPLAVDDDNEILRRAREARKRVAPYTLIQKLFEFGDLYFTIQSAESSWILYRLARVTFYCRLRTRANKSIHRLRCKCALLISKSESRVSPLSIGISNSGRAAAAVGRAGGCRESARREQSSRASRFLPGGIRGETNPSRATRPNNDRRRERCRNDAQQWTTVQRASRRDAGAYRGSCPRHGYVPSMKESKRNNCISGPGGHCSTAAHARPYLTVLTRRAEAALRPAVPRARKNLAYDSCTVHAEDLASSRRE